MTIKNELKNNGKGDFTIYCFVLALLVTVLLLFPGCSTEEVSDRGVGGSDPEIVDDATYEGNYNNINSYLDLAGAFSEIALLPYFPDEEWIEYRYLFLETYLISGREVYHVKFTANHGLKGSESEIWITEEQGDLKAIKAIVDGIEVEKPQLYIWYMLPLRGLITEPGDLGSDWPDWDLAGQIAETWDLGRGQLQVTVYEIFHPDLQEKIVFTVAEISGRKFLLGFEHSEGRYFGNYKVTRLIPR